MPYTFGATTTSRVDVGMTTDFFNAGRNVLITAWVYPTTLTATRKLFGTGATWGAEIDTTTSSIRFRSDNTTDGQWTFPAGLALNTWTFVAIMVLISDTTNVSVTAWTGPIDGPVVQRTVTAAVAPVGALVAGGTSLSIGNSSGSLAFQGDVGPVFAYMDAFTSQWLNSLGPVDGSAPDQARVDQLFRAWIIPLWGGDIASVINPGLQGTTGFRRGLVLATDMDGPMSAPAFFRPSLQPQHVLGTVTGTVTVSTRPNPRPFNSFGLGLPSRRRR